MIGLRRHTSAATARERVMSMMSDLDVVLLHLPDDPPELVLSKLLQESRQLRDQRLKKATKSKRNAAALVMGNLQKRLLCTSDGNKAGIWSGPYQLDRFLIFRFMVGVTCTDQHTG